MRRSSAGAKLARRVRTLHHVFFDMVLRAPPDAGRTVFDPNWERNETERKVAGVLEQIAAQVGAPNIQAGMYAATASGLA